jgi:serine phosphatase RsbU (regulator of sigma subunit)
MTDISGYGDREIKSMIRRLKFPDHFEKKFLSTYAEKSVNFNRFGGIIFVLLYFFNVFTDLNAFPELNAFSIINRTWMLVYGIFCLIIAAFRPFRKYYTGFIIFGYSMAGIFLIMYMIIGEGLFRYLYHSGFMLVIIGFFILRIRFFTASLFGFVLIALFIGLNFYFMEPGEFNILLHNSGNIAGMYLGGLIISYMNEFQMRGLFIQMLQTESEKEKVGQRNMIIERDLSLARKIQKQYIPVRNPSPNIRSFYRPMDMLGGDFFDYIVFGDGGRIGIFISDVSGHGVTAAFITAMLKTTIAQAGDRIEDPAALMTHINDSLLGNTGDNFITAIYGIYDPAGRSLRYANAGHVPPFIIDGDGARKMEVCHSVPLVSFSRDILDSRDKKYETREILLPEKSKLLLYTDGLVEARSVHDPSLMFEYADINGILYENRNLPGREFLAALYRRLVEFRGSDSFEDDVCMICVDID